MAEIEVIYARVPRALKEAIDGYRHERGMTITTAVVDLLNRGMESVMNEESATDLERRLAEVTGRLSAAEAKGREAQATVETLEEREQNLMGAYRVLAERVKQNVGTCPTCRSPITGHDILVKTRCVNSHSLAKLLAPPKGQLDPEYLFLVGAVGLLVG